MLSFPYAKFVDILEPLALTMPDEESLSGATLTTTSTIPASKEASAAANNAAILAAGDGHEKLAEMMNRLPTCAVFRTFGTLSAINILYYQAELCQLEHKLRAAAEQDRTDPDSIKQQYFKCFDHLSEGKIEQGNLAPCDNVQWQTILRIRQVLKEYSMLTLQSLEQ